MATASGYTASYLPANAIDGSASTYWQSSTTTGWLAVRFAAPSTVDEVHVHYKTTKYPSLSLWADRDGDGTYETKVWSATKNGVLDVVAGFAPTSTYGIKVTIDAKSGSNKPMIAELEAYLRYDTDGDGLLNSFESGTVYYFTSAVATTPVALADSGPSDLTLQTNRLSGVPSRGLLDFTVDHAAKEELSASLAYWNGTAWVETPVWDPGGRLVTPQITAPAAGGFVGTTTTVEATVASPTLVTQVAFYVDAETSPRGSVATPEGAVYRWTLDTSTLAEGTHTLRARSTDVWGGTYEGTVSVRADRTPPTVRISSPLGGAVLPTRDVQVQWTATDTGVGVKSLAVSLDQLTWTSIDAHATSYTFHLPSDGFWTAYVRATDMGDFQAVESVSFRADSMPPTIYITHPRNNAELASGNIVLTWFCEDEGSWIIDVEVGFDTSADHNATGLNSWPFTLRAGDHTLSVRVKDAAGHVNGAVVYVTVDTTPPTVTITEPLTGASVRNLVTIRATATDDYTRVPKVEFYVDGILRATATNGPLYYSATWDTSGVAEGTHSIVARAYDSVGWTADSAAVTVKVDRTPPTATIVNPLGYDVCDGWTSRMQGTASDNLGLGSVYFIDASIGQPGAPTTWSGTKDVTFRYSTGGGNTHTYVIMPTDAAGNTGATQSTDVLVHSATSYYCKGGYGPVEAPIGDAFAASEVLLSWPGDGYLVSRESFALTAGMGASGTQSGYYAASGNHRVVVDLTRTLSSMTAAERSARILPPGIPSEVLNAFQSWQLTIRDWTSGSPGSVLAVSLRIEETTSANSPDTDGDGLADGQEVQGWGTYPIALDSDADGLDDAYEIVSHDLVIVVDGGSTTKTVQTDRLAWDTDNDGLADGEEWSLGMDRAITDPTDPDTDNDGLWDGPTIGAHLGELSYGANATLTDTDGDTLSDWLEVNPRNLVLTVNGAQVNRSITTLPYSTDSDGDGLKDNEEWTGTSVYGVKTDPSAADTDGDGLADGQERYMKEVAMPTRRSAGTYIDVPLSVTVAGPVERVTVSYGLSTADVSNFVVILWQGGSGIYLRNHEGNGLFNFSSKDVPDWMWGGGTYDLEVSSSVSGGVLEKFSLLWTIRTSPIKADTDADGLNDTEETTYGQDGWITDPQLPDTDGDTWGDAYEISTKGTNPLSADTDGDGARDNVDLDPLHNLLLAVRVDQIHHGDAWWDPELLGVVRVNDDYAWVTEHRLGSADGSDDHTASFYLTYYADVPDDVAVVDVRIVAWSQNDLRGDDVLVDASFGQFVNAPPFATTWSNGNSWLSYAVWTVGLAKTTTLLITDEQVTVTSTSGQTRMATADRFFVFTLDLTSAWWPLVPGVNTILVPRSVFLDTKLKADFDAGNFAPLPNAAVYGDDLSQASLSDGVAAVIAGTLDGGQAVDVLVRLLENAAGVQTHAYVDITTTALVADLPYDVVKILPWAAVVNGPTGALPADFWTKIGAAVTTVVNALVYVGQLIYKGLVALGTFLVNLAQAIADWGMKALGTVVDAVVSVAQTIASVASTFVNWVISFASQALQVAIQAILSTVKALLDLTIGNLVTLARQAVASVETSSTILTAMAGYVFDLAQKIALIPIAIRAAEIAIAVVTAGVGFVALKAIGKLTGEFIVHALSLMAIGLTAEYLVTETLDSVEWVEKSTVDFFKSIGFAVNVAAGVAKGALAIYRMVHANRAMPWWRFVAFGFSLISLMIALFAELYNLPGNVLFFLDLVSIALGFGGLLIYWTESLNMLNQATDAISSLGATVEKAVVYCTLPIAFAKVVVHGREPGYG